MNEMHWAGRLFIALIVCGGVALATHGMPIVNRLGYACFGAVASAVVVEWLERGMSK